MQIFKKIPDDLNAVCQKYLTELLQRNFGYESESQYINIFNNDTDFIDRYLSYSEAEQSMFANFDKAQSEYNDTILKAKKRWEKSKQSFYVAKNTMHEMSIHKNELAKYQADVKKIEENKSLFELLMDTDQVWTEIWMKTEFAWTIPQSNYAEKKVPDLESLKKRFRRQSVFGRFGYQDILKAYQHIIHYENQLAFWLEKTAGKTDSIELNAFVEICQFNLTKVEELKKAICFTLNERLQHGIQHSHLTIDDPVAWIESALETSIGIKLAVPSYLLITDIPNILTISKRHTPDLYQDILDSLSKKNIQKKGTFSYQIIEGEFVPTELVSSYPKNYHYFSEENPIILQLNLLNTSINSLLTNLKLNEVKSIQQLMSDPGFQGLRELSEMIAKENLHVMQSKPNSIMSNVSFYTNIGSVYQFEQSLMSWQESLRKIESQSKLKAAEIAKFISQNIEKDLFRDLQYNLFEFPAETLHCFKLFIEKYGDDQVKEIISNLCSPIYVLNKFDLIKERVNTSKIEINDDTVQALLQFAKLYCSAEQIKAIETLTNLLEGEGFPKNTEDDSKFVKKILPIFNGDNPRKELLNFLEGFSENYLSKIADFGNDSVYRFLLRFHPKLAVLWTSEREKEIEQKYTDVCQLFSGMTLCNSESEKTVNYVGLLYSHDQRKKTDYIHSLTVFLQGYAEQYDGVSSLLGPAIYVLYQYNSENLPYLSQFIEKRIQYLIKNNVELDDQDMDWFFQMRNNEELNQIILSALEKNYKGSSSNLTSIFMVNTNMKIFECIFHRYVSRNFLKMDDKKIESFMDSISMLPSNKPYRATIDNILIKIISKLNGPYYFQCQEKIQSWLKTHDSIEVIEHYFLNTLEIALKSHNWDALKITVNEISKWLGLAQNHKSAFTLAENQNKLCELYQSYFDVYHREKWNSQYQYLTEWITSPKTQFLTQNSRVKWFESFILGKTEYNKELTDFKSVDVKIHHANQSVPKVDMCLSDFYGTDNLTKIISLIREKIAVFDSGMTEEVLEIISRYLSEREIKALPDGYLAYQEFEIYQKFVKLWNAISQYNFKESLQLHRVLMIDFKAISRLSRPTEVSDKNPGLSSRAKYFQNKLTEIKECVDLLFKQNLFNQFYLSGGGDSTLQDIYIQLFGEQEIPALSALIHDAKQLYGHFVQLNNNLSQGKWNLVKLDLMVISKIKSCMLPDKIEFIIKELIEPTQALASDDRLKSIVAYTRLIKNNYASIEERENDEREVKAFNHDQENMAECAKKITTDILSKFKQCENMSEISSIFSKNNTIRTILLQNIDPQHFGLLQHHLVIQLKGLFDGICPKEYSLFPLYWESILYDISHWEALSGLLDFIKTKYKHKKMPNEEGFLDLAKSSMEIANGCFEELQNLFVLSNSDSESIGDFQRLRYEIEQKQNNCLRAAIFIRFFGSIEQQQQLEKWLDSIAAEQRKIMMKGISNKTVEHALGFVEKLIGLSGNEEQKIENNRLNTEWFMYHGVDALPQANSDVAVALRKAALEEAFHDYLPDFEKQLFSYFIDKFKCEEKGFFSLVKEYKSKYGLDNLLDVDKLIKTSDSKEIAAKLKALQLEMPQEQKQVLFFKYKSTVEPSKRDAIKFLFALGMSTKLNCTIELWKRQLNENPKATITRFVPALIRQPLTEMLVQLNKKYDLGKNQFVEGVQQCINLEKKYFVNWNQANLSPRDESPSKIRLIEKERRVAL